MLCRASRLQTTPSVLNGNIQSRYVAHRTYMCGQLDRRVWKRSNPPQHVTQWPWPRNGITFQWGESMVWATLRQGNFSNHSRAGMTHQTRRLRNWSCLFSWLGGSLTYDLHLRPGHSAYINELLSNRLQNVQTVVYNVHYQIWNIPKTPKLEISSWASVSLQQNI